MTEGASGRKRGRERRDGRGRIEGGRKGGELEETRGGSEEREEWIKGGRE